MKKVHVEGMTVEGKRKKEIVEVSDNSDIVELKNTYKGTLNIGVEYFVHDLRNNIKNAVGFLKPL